MEEQQYLDLIQHILDHGEHRPDRTGTGTLAVFAPPPLKFSLADGAFPLLTTKRVHLRSIIHELLWFISGNTSTAPLQAVGVKIWDGNGSRAYLDSIGLTDRPEGDLGPVYGFQWRHFGAEYKGAGHDYTGEGVDQLAEVIRKLKHSPYDRRIILSAWNVADLKLMALPPCHMFAQFYVSFPRPVAEPAGPSDGVSQPQPLPQLHCQLYQRSCDMGLGVPFNIASYALLTKMIAHVAGLEAGTFTHVMGDAHVYKDHVEPLKRQLAREPRPFPKLNILRTVGDIDGFKFEDFEVTEYNPWPGIAMQMSV
ncbi:thymidylate synthase [Drechslerella stenobrocha 248]|uniref:thymidylate synthase n=1 Tax=Drechslerella stenobrocha 248 TaxID=1043628 RepID=W7HXM8_9PEZI|nr:thymidylate synthase [Drechslerella stenobrocha 248]